MNRKKNQVDFLLIIAIVIVILLVFLLTSIAFFCFWNAPSKTTASIIMELSSCQSVKNEAEHEHNYNNKSPEDKEKYKGNVFITYVGEKKTSVKTFSRIEIKHFRALARKIKKQYGGRIKKASKIFGQDSKLILAVIIVESRGIKTAKSSSGAIGLMQLKPGTAMMLSEFNHLRHKRKVAKSLLHPYKNILGGTEYLAYLEKKFKSQEAVLAAYNMGPTKVARLLKKGFNPSGYKYVQKIKTILNIL